MSEVSFSSRKCKGYLLRRFLITLGVFVSVIFCVHSCRVIHDKYTRALKLIAREKYKASVQLLTDIFRTDPGLAKTYRKLAEAFYLQDKPEAGIEYFNALSAENPGNPLLRYGRAYIHQKLGYPEKAADEYQHLLMRVKPCILIYKDFVDNCEKLDALSMADSVLKVISLKYPENGALLNGLGYLAIKQRRWQEGIALLDSSIIKGDDILEAYYLKAAVFFSTSRYDSFLITSKQGLQKSELSKDLRYRCIFTGNIGLAHNYLGNYPEAIHYTRKAIKLAKRSGEIQEEVRSTGNLGLSYRDTQQYAKSIECIQKAVRGAIRIKDRNREGLFYRNIGSVYQMMGEYSKAIAYFNKALPMARALNDRYTECFTLLSIGFTNWSYGNYNEALASFNSSLELACLTGNTWAEGRCYSGIGLVHWKQGDYSKALDYSEKSLDIATKIGDNEGISYSLGNIAIIYDQIGNVNRALEYYNKGLEVSKHIGNKSEIGRNLVNIGCTYYELNDYDNAQLYFQQAAEIFKKTGERKELANALGDLGFIMIEKKEYKKASAYLEQALTIGQDIGTKDIVTNQFINLGYLEYELGNLKSSYDYFNEGLRYAISLNDPKDFRESQTGLAMVLWKQGKTEKALDHAIAAIDKVDEVQKLLTISEFKSDYFDKHINIYENILDLLASMNKDAPGNGYDIMAFHYAEKSKARAFLQNLLESKADIRSGVSPELKSKEQEILRKIADRQKQLLHDDSDKRKRKELASELKKYENDFKKLEHEIKSNNPKYFNLYSPEPYSVEKVRADILHDNEVILEYAVGRKHSYLWMLSKDEFFLYELPGEDSIAKAVKEYLFTINQQVGLTNPFSAHTAKSIEVFNLLLRPCIKNLDKNSHLILVADDILHLLPFESLVIEKSGGNGSLRYLIEEFTVSYSPSSTSLAFLPGTTQKKPADQKYLLAFADPVFQPSAAASETRGKAGRHMESGLLAPADEEPGLFSQYRTGEPQLHALPFARTEVQNISGLFPKGKSVIYIGAEANESTLKNESLDRYDYIHFATHGLIEESVPFRSGIVLSAGEGSEEDGILQVNEILNLELNAEMVVLSACETALGKLYHGEGMEGISRAFIYAGASSVVVSLWNINDRSAAQLMTRFYDSLITGSDKSMALQKAKRSMIKAGNEYSHPYYWAPYILMGNRN
ncbi:MAG: CHAT domain-containing protein [Bacteroidales bacterium]|nr:CHAT domain-containing protein [Bacteroidales bacterium]